MHFGETTKPFSWTSVPKKFANTFKFSSQGNEDHIILDKMNLGEIKEIKVTVKNIHTQNKDNETYTDSKGNPYLRLFLEIEDPKNGDKDSFYENLWANVVTDFVMALGFKPASKDGRNTIPDMNIFTQPNNNTCQALIVKTTYKNRRTGEDVPYLKVKEWIPAGGELKSLNEFEDVLLF